LHFFQAERQPALRDFRLVSRTRSALAVLVAAALLASVCVGVGVPAATAAAPAGYTPGSPAGSEYQQQLAGAREIGARDGAHLRGGQHAAAPQLFGPGITADASGHRASAEAANGDAATSNSGGGTARADARERSAIAAAARAPLEGPSSSLITGLLVLAALLATALLTQLLRRGAAS